MLDVQTAFIALVGEDRQVVKSSVGLPEASTFPREMPLSHSFCKHAVAGREGKVRIAEFRFRHRDGEWRELEDGAGKQFDPGVVEALLALEEDLEAFLAGG